MLDWTQIWRNSNCFKLDRSNFELTRTQVHPPKLNFEPIRILTPYKKPELQTCLARNGPNPQSQIWKNWTLNPSEPKFVYQNWTISTYPQEPKIPNFEPNTTRPILWILPLYSVIESFIRSSKARHPFILVICGSFSCQTSSMNGYGYRTFYVS